MSEIAETAPGLSPLRESSGFIFGRMGIKAEHGDGGVDASK